LSVVKLLSDSDRATGKSNRRVPPVCSGTVAPTLAVACSACD
jgi:hypothetical protein